MLTHKNILMLQISEIHRAYEAFDQGVAIARTEIDQEYVSSQIAYNN